MTAALARRSTRRARASVRINPSPAGGGSLSTHLAVRPRSLASRAAAARRSSSSGARTGVLSLAAATGRTGRGLGRGIIDGAPFVALVLVLAVLTGCNGGGDKKLILSANALQIQAAGAYDGAKALEDAAGRDCAAKAAAAGQALAAPTRETVPQIRAACASLGAPIPFDPFKLADLAGPLNGAYEAIRAADAIRRGAQPGDLPRSIGAVIEAISRLWQAAADVGVKLPANTLGAAR